MGPLRAQLISTRAGKRYAAAVDIFSQFIWYMLGVALNLSDLALVDQQLVVFVGGAVG